MYASAANVRNSRMLRHRTTRNSTVWPQQDPAEASTGAGVGDGVSRESCCSSAHGRRRGSFVTLPSSTLRSGSDSPSSRSFVAVVEHRRGTPPARSRRCRPASFASCLPFVSPAASASGRCRRRSTWRSRSCGGPRSSRGRSTRLPMAAWMATSNWWRSISPLSFLTSFRPRRSAWSRWTTIERASTLSPATRMSSRQRSLALIADHLVVHRAVAAGRALQLIVEVVDHLGQGQFVRRGWRGWA